MDMFLRHCGGKFVDKDVLKSRALYGTNSTLTKQCQLVMLAVCCGVADLIERSTSEKQYSPVCNFALLIFFGAHLLSHWAWLYSRDSLDTKYVTVEAYLSDSKISFSQFCHASNSTLVVEPSSKNLSTPALAQVDDLISWRQLRQVTSASGDLDLCDGDDLLRATGSFENSDGTGTRLSHVYQLTGFADPVYAEAYVTVHDYDIILEILIISRTAATLSNLTVELSTMGDLKLVERPLSLTIGPLDQRSISANIKVSSTETGHIFGTIVYENSSNAEKSIINLNSIHLDIMDYIRPALCTDETFRAMWAEFEWENKVAIATAISELGTFLEHIISETNMRCLTPQSALGGTSSFLAANLYAKSIFWRRCSCQCICRKKRRCRWKTEWLHSHPFKNPGHCAFTRRSDNSCPAP